MLTSDLLTDRLTVTVILVSATFPGCPSIVVVCDMRPCDLIISCFNMVQSHIRLDTLSWLHDGRTDEKLYMFVRPLR